MIVGCAIIFVSILVIEIKGSVEIKNKKREEI